MAALAAKESTIKASQPGKPAGNVQSPRQVVAKPATTVDPAATIKVTVIPSAPGDNRRIGENIDHHDRRAGQGQ